MTEFWKESIENLGYFIIILFVLCFCAGWVGHAGYAWLNQHEEKAE